MTLRDVLGRFRDFSGLASDGWRAFLDGDDGARASLAARPANSFPAWLGEDLLAALPNPPALDEAGRRVLAALGAIDPATRGGASTIPYVARWLGGRAAQEGPDEAWLDDVARAMGLGADARVALALQASNLGSSARALLALDDDAWTLAIVRHAPFSTGALYLVAQRAPARLKRLVPAALAASPPHTHGAPLALAAAVLPRGAFADAPLGDAPDTAAFREHLTGAPELAFGRRFVACGAAQVRAKHLDAGAWARLQSFVEHGAPGGENALVGVPVDVSSAFVNALPLPRPPDEPARRLLTALVVARHAVVVAPWADAALRAEANGEDAFAALDTALEAGGLPTADRWTLFAERLLSTQAVNGVTSYGRFLLAADDATLRALLTAQLAPRCWNTTIFPFIAARAPARLPLLLDVLRTAGENYRVGVALSLLAGVPGAQDGATAFDLDVVTKPGPADHGAMQRGQPEHDAFQAWKRLVARDRDAHLDGARAAARGMLVSKHQWLVGDAAQWLVRVVGSEALPELSDALAANEQSGAASTIAGALLAAFGARAPVAVDWYLQQPAYLQLTAIQRITSAGTPISDARVSGTLEKIFAAGEPSSVPSALDIAARLDWAWTAPHAWDLVVGKSARVRLAAAKQLTARRDAETWQRAEALLTHKQASARLGSIALLPLLDAVAAAALFEARLDAEGNEEVRDQLLLALKDTWQKAGRVATWADVEKRVQKAKLGRALTPWLDVDQLAPLRLRAGREVPKAAVAWLLSRQARVAGVRPDLDAEMLYGLLDRATSGAAAAQLLDGFFAGGALAEEGWVITVVGLLGDERVVAPLTRAVHAWVKERRGTFAEYGVQALALLGNDAALKSVDDLALRYAQKPKNVGEAAAEAFDEAAERAGLTVDELRDRVVPWLGFPEDGSPWIVDGGGKQLVLGIDDAFAVMLRDAANGKPVRSLAKAAPADVKVTVKDLRDLVRNASALQCARLQNLMVVGTRWSLPRFTELFLKHPLLAPYGRRLVWTDGVATFRAGTGGTLVDVGGAPVPVARDASIGIAHPLALADDVRAAWAALLGEQPFAQLARVVARPADDERGVEAWQGVSGSEVPTRVMKGRTARLGWRRGDSSGGYIGDYWKAFPVAGVIARLDVEDMPVVLDMSSSCTVRGLTFVRKDEGRVVLGEVDPIAFSEAVADAYVLAGKPPPGVSTGS